MRLCRKEADTMCDGYPAVCPIRMSANKFRNLPASADVSKRGISWETETIGSTETTRTWEKGKREIKIKNKNVEGIYTYKTSALSWLAIKVNQLGGSLLCICCAFSSSFSITAATNRKKDEIKKNAKEKKNVYNVEITQQTAIQYKKKENGWSMLALVDYKSWIFYFDIHLFLLFFSPSK